jgi:dynein heavy chain
MNTLLAQEVFRCNRFIVVFKKHLAELQKALRGEIGFSDELDAIARSLTFRQVPAVWAYPLGFLSLKPLGAWMEELIQRITFFSDWIEKGKPAVYWFSGFFFPQAFITGTLQNYARKYKLAIDRLSFHFKIRDDLSIATVTEPPKDGCYIHGLFLEGASWNYSRHLLDDPIPKELYASLPIIELIPAIDKAETVTNAYRCPLYKVLSRAGTLSTTGHSTNFIMNLELPTDQPEDVWIRKGVAGFQSLKA